VGWWLMSRGERRRKLEMQQALWRPE
jgi:hypothetical protein